MKMKKSRSLLLYLMGPILLGVLLYVYAERWLRALILYLSHASWARQLVTGFSPAWFVASRFVAGETIDDAMRVTAELNRQGLLATLDYLGESVTDPHEARKARDEILQILDAIQSHGLDAGVSVKLTQLGVAIDPDLAFDNMQCILERASQLNLFVRIDMEESAFVDTTLGLHDKLREEYGTDTTGVVIQAYLYRSEADVQALIEDGASVRLCKGAYMEPPEVAFPQKKDTDANFIRLMKMLLGPHARKNGVQAAIATHDEAMVNATVEFAQKATLPRDEFEMQMLFGVRRELQSRLAAQGYRVRVYVPYGTAWYPYLMRRLAERPANLWFFMSNLVRH
jgi:proline dehydrogenase